MHERFRKFAERTTTALGTAWAFSAAVVFTVLWGLSGFIFGFSDTWQLTMNTVASIVAFLMVFVIQNTQSRDARAIHLKLDELIRVLDGARLHLVEVEALTDQEMDSLRREFRAIHEKALRDGGIRRIEEDAPPPIDGDRPTSPGEREGGREHEGDGWEGREGEGRT